MRRPLILAAAVLAVLAVPAVAARFTHEVSWTAGDALFAGALLGGAAASLELALRVLRRPLHRGLAAGGIGVAVLLVWAQGAVGVL